MPEGFLPYNSRVKLYKNAVEKEKFKNGHIPNIEYYFNYFI